MRPFLRKVAALQIGSLSTPIKQNYRPAVVTQLHVMRRGYSNFGDPLAVTEPVRLEWPNIITSPIRIDCASSCCANRFAGRLTGEFANSVTSFKAHNAFSLEQGNGFNCYQSLGHTFKTRSGTATYRNAYRLLPIDGLTQRLYSPTCGCRHSLPVSNTQNKEWMLKGDASEHRA